MQEKPETSFFSEISLIKDGIIWEETKLNSKQSTYLQIGRKKNLKKKNRKGDWNLKVYEKLFHHGKKHKLLLDYLGGITSKIL